MFDLFVSDIGSLRSNDADALEYKTKQTYQEIDKVQIEDDDNPDQRRFTIPTWDQLIDNPEMLERPGGQHGQGVYMTNAIRLFATIRRSLIALKAGEVMHGFDAHHLAIIGADSYGEWNFLSA